MSFLSASILIFLVMDPFGNAPVFLVLLNRVPEAKKQRVIFRELFIALAVLVFFLFAGPLLLRALHISEPSLRIAGGIILFLIALRMVFIGDAAVFRAESLEEEPFIVPLAIPLLAGPSAIAVVMLLMGQEPGRWLQWLGAILLAWGATSIVLLLSAKLDRFIGPKGMKALQHLMGLILTAIAVEMFMQGFLSVLKYQ